MKNAKQLKILWERELKIAKDWIEAGKGDKKELAKIASDREVALRVLANEFQH